MASERAMGYHSRDVILGPQKNFVSDNNDKLFESPCIID